MMNGRNADPSVVAAKMARIREPHVAPLNELADRVAEAEGLRRGEVPYVDPDTGGVNARMLVLLDNPSTKAESTSGASLLSLDNNDRTARNCREAYARHGVDWGDVVHWNVVPFPVAGVKNGGSTPAERARGAHWTREAVSLLPNLEIVLLLGGSARDGWRRASITRAGRQDSALFDVWIEYRRRAREVCSRESRRIDETHAGLSTHLERVGLR